jgi:hypothetical protein
MPETPEALLTMLIDRLPVERRASVGIHVLHVNRTPKAAGVSA